MNWAKINQDIVKAIINGTKWGHVVPHCWTTDGEYLFVTTNGYCGYFIPKDKVKFVVEGAEIDKPFGELQSVIAPENEIRATNTYCKGYRDRFFMRVFKADENGETHKTYIDVTFLKPLDGEEGIITFYQADKTKFPGVRPVIAAKGDVPLMLLLPVRVLDESEFD